MPGKRADENRKLRLIIKRMLRAMCNGRPSSPMGPEADRWDKARKAAEDVLGGY